MIERYVWGTTIKEISSMMMKKKGHKNIISFIGNYRESSRLIEELIMSGVEIGSVCIENPEVSGYDDAYIVTIANNTLNCFVLRVNKEYYNTYGNYTFIMDDCNSKLLKYIKSDEIIYCSFDKEC